MFSRFVRNPLPRVARNLALALLVTTVLGAADAGAARLVDYVDGHGMAATDNTEDPRDHAGGSLEGDPWEGEQRPADPVTESPEIFQSTSSVPATTAWTIADFWSRLLAFLTSLMR